MSLTKKQVKQRKQDRHRERMAAKQKQQTMRLLMAGTLIVVLLIAGGLALYFSHNHAKSGAGSGTHNNGQAAQTFDYKKQPMLGKNSAPVKIAEFGDFKCPVCRQFDQTILPKVKADFIQTGKVDYYFFNFPVIQGSMPAELAAESVYHHEPKSYWKFHEALYAHQKSEKLDWATPTYLVNLAEMSVPNLNPQQMRKDIIQKTYASAVNSDNREGLKAGVTGTPAIFINGTKVDFKTEFNYPELKKLIDKAYQKAAKQNG